jgi:hypothetical protein
LPVEPALFWTLAATLVAAIPTTGVLSLKTKERRFKEHFGIKPEMCASLWALCLPFLPVDASPMHLLWTLYFLKQYNTECVNAAFSNCDEKTFRKWCWIMIGVLSSLDLVS